MSKRETRAEVAWQYMKDGVARTTGQLISLVGKQTFPTPAIAKQAIHDAEDIAIEQGMKLASACPGNGNKHQFVKIGQPVVPGAEFKLKVEQGVRQSRLADLEFAMRHTAGMTVGERRLVKRQYAALEAEIAAGKATYEYQDELERQNTAMRARLARLEG